jgi:hypothetical protein
MIVRRCDQEPLDTGDYLGGLKREMPDRIIKAL